MKYRLIKLLAVLVGLALFQQVDAQRTLYFGNVDESLYPDNMSFTCVVEESGNRILDCEIAAFDENDNLRGCYFSDAQGIIFLMVHGKNTEGVIHFKVVTGQGTDSDPYVVRDINETYHFFLNDIKGEYYNPYVFTVGTEAPSATLNTCGFATFSCAEDVKIKTEGVKAYKAVVSGECITLSELNGYIPAGSGVLLYGEGVEEAVAFEKPDDEDSAADNLTDNELQATTVSANAVVDINSISGTIWALGSNNSFLRYIGTEFAANKAFLVHEPASDASEMHIVFNDEDNNATAIEGITEKPGFPSFDLWGRSTKEEGLLIREGKIVFVTRSK